MVQNLKPNRSENRAVLKTKQMNTKDKILKILSDFGMTGVKASEAMGITVNTFNQKKAPNSLRHSFNEKNLSDLVEFIKNKSKNICT